MKIFSIAIGLGLLVAAVSVSCDKLRTPVPSLQPAPAVTGKSTQPDDERTTFSQETQIEIDELREAIAKLKTKAEAASNDIRTKLVEEATRLETERLHAQEQLGLLKTASVDSWKQLKETLRTSVDRLKDAVQKAR
jgi:hypothetical protein